MMFSRVAYCDLGGTSDYEIPADQFDEFLYGGVYNTPENQCPQGQYWSSSDETCVDCEPGYFCSNGERQSCSAGTFSSNSGASECLPCETGYYAENSGATECDACPQGTYSNEERTACVPCTVAGQYLDGAECKACPTEGYDAELYRPYRFADYTGISQCGIELNQQGTTKCNGEISVKWHYDGNTSTWVQEEGNSVSVSPMSYVYVEAPEDANSDWCKNCPDDSINISGGQSACTSCPPGHCMDGSTCRECTAGYMCPYGNDHHVQACDADFLGSYIYGIEICPQGTFSRAGQETCSGCAPGYTTEGPGTAYNPQASVCIKGKIKFVIGEGNPSEFPACLNQGRINSRVVSRSRSE